MVLWAGMNRLPAIITALLSAWLAAAGALLAWSLVDTVFTPLARWLWTAQKSVGAVAGVLMVATAASPRLRAVWNAALDTLGAAPENERRRWERLFFSAVACSLAFLAIYKHNSLQSHSHDLGIMLNVAWNVAHGNGFYDPIIRQPSFLGDHWSPVVGAFAPVVRLWPDARPFLLVQTLAMVAGAAGLYRIALHLTRRRRWAAIVAVAYLAHPFFHRTHRFDFHPEALSVPLLAWGIYAFLADRPWRGVILMMLTWFMKEDLPTVTFAAAAALFALTPHRRAAAVLAAGSVAMFALAVGVLMPHFLGHTDHTHMSRYANLGDSLGEVMRTILFSPHRVAADVLGDITVWRTALHLVAGFLFLPLLNGPFSLAALAAWGPHMISSYAMGQRVLSGPYSTGVLILLGSAASLGLARILARAPWRARLERLGPAPLLMIILVNWGFGVPRYTKPVERARIEAFHRVRALIPGDAAVCAQGDLGPHVAFRRQVTMFPDWEGADYLLLEPGGNTWMLDQNADFETEKARVLMAGRFEPVASEAGFELYRRAAP